VSRRRQRRFELCPVRPTSFDVPAAFEFYPASKSATDWVDVFLCSSWLALDVGGRAMSVCGAERGEGSSPAEPTNHCRNDNDRRSVPVRAPDGRVRLLPPVSQSAGKGVTENYDSAKEAEPIGRDGRDLPGSEPAIAGLLIEHLVLFPESMRHQGAEKHGYGSGGESQRDQHNRSIPDRRSAEQERRASYDQKHCQQLAPLQDYSTALRHQQFSLTLALGQAASNSKWLLFETDCRGVTVGIEQ
jgi:hypothetical protein